MKEVVARNKGSAISRVLEIIEAISVAERALSPAELAFMLDIPKPSIHRLIQQLATDGYLQVNMRGLLIPGKRLQHIAVSTLYSHRDKAARLAILRQLADETGETCGIAIADGINMVYCDRVQSSWPLQLNLPEGSRVPLGCTASGKLYLSTLSKSQRTRIIHHLPLTQMARNTLTQPEELEAALQAIKEADMGQDNEEFVTGMVACSVPIRDADGRMFACLFTHAPTVRKSLKELQAFEPAMRRAAADLGALSYATDGVDAC